MDLEKNKKDVLDLLRQVDRPGMDRLIKFIEEETDYFTAPSSTKFHLAVEGGLAEHSLNVMDILQKKIEAYGMTDRYPLETAIICGLCHDLCKCNIYVKDAKSVPLEKDPQSGRVLKWGTEEFWKVEDLFPLGHGEKSLYLLAKQGVPLTDEEALAIRWHLAAFDPAVNFGFPNGYAYKAAAKVSPLVTLLFTADVEASNLVDDRAKDAPMETEAGE